MIDLMHAELDVLECVAIARGVYYPAAGLSRSPPVPSPPAPVQMCVQACKHVRKDYKVRSIDWTYSCLSPPSLYVSPPSLPRRIDDRKWTGYSAARHFLLRHPLCPHCCRCCRLSWWCYYRCRTFGPSHPAVSVGFRTLYLPTCCC